MLQYLSDDLIEELYEFLNIKDKVILATTNNENYLSVNKHFIDKYNTQLQNIKTIICIYCGNINQFTNNNNICKSCVYNRKCDLCCKIRLDKYIVNVCKDSNQLYNRCTSIPIKYDRYDFNKVKNILKCNFSCKYCKKTKIYTAFNYTSKKNIEWYILSEKYVYNLNQQTKYACKECYDKRDYIREDYEVENYI